MYSIGRIGRCSARDGPLAKVFRPKTLLSDSVVLVTGRSGHQTEDPMHGTVSAPNCLNGPTAREYFVDIVHVTGY